MLTFLSSLFPVFYAIYFAWLLSYLHLAYLSYQ